MRVTLLTEIPATYRVPLFDALAQRLELTVLFLRAAHPERQYEFDGDRTGFRWRVLPGRHYGRGLRWLVVNRGVGGALADAAPDVLVLGGWNQPAFWRALVWARRHRVPAVAWVESTARDARPGGLGFAKRLLVRACAAVVVPGSAARDYVRSLGVQDGRIAVAPNAVDGARFAGARTPQVRVTYLYVGRLSPEKGPDVLLRAAADVDADVVLAGGGPEEARLRALAPANARLLGHVPPAELAARYASADAVVVPSRSEVWGMALNEAAAAGAPLVASDAVGGAYDLIEEGVNGYRFPSGDHDALAAILRRIAADPHWRETAGVRSRELAARFTPEAWAEAVEALARNLVSK